MPIIRHDLAKGPVPGCSCVQCAWERDEIARKSMTRSRVWRVIYDEKTKLFSSKEKAEAFAAGFLAGRRDATTAISEWEVE